MRWRFKVSVNWEKRVLALVLFDNSCLYQPAFASLKAEDFAEDRNQLIFSTMKYLACEGREIDLISLVEKLNDFGDLGNVGGAPYVVSLVEDHVR
jgi:replicative DNA helicase